MSQSATLTPSSAGPVQALANILASGNDLEKCLAAQGLGQLGRDDASQALIAALRDADEDVRIDAVNAVISLSIVEAVPVIVENITQDPSLDAKSACIVAAGHFRAREAVGVLCKLVSGMAPDEIAWDEEDISQSECDEWPEIQLKAIEALGRIGDESAVGDIRAAMEDEFGPEITRPGLMALTCMGTAGRAVVLEYLRSKEARRRRVALSVLSTAQRETLLEFAGELLSDPDPQLRLGVLNALPDSDPRIVDRLSDTDVAVRAAAAARLTRLHPSRVELFLDDKDDAVRIAVLNELSESGSASVGAEVKDKLLGWLEKGEPALVTAVCKVLVRVAPADAGPHLRRIALRRAAPIEQRRAALSGLASLQPDDTIETLVSIARDPLRPIRLSAIGAIAKIATDHSSALSHNAREVLLAALAGDLIVPPEESSESKETSSGSPPATVGRGTENSDSETLASTHGAHAAKEDDAQRINRIRIDRDGNIVEEGVAAASAEGIPASELHSKTSSEDAIESDADQFPVSTLSALQDNLYGPADVAQDGVELTPEDLSFLELAQGRTGKKKLSPEQKTPAHTDVRVLAARLLVDLTDADVVDALVAVLSERDDELRMASAMSLAKVLEAPGVLQPQTAQRLASYMPDKSPVIRLWLARAAGSEGSILVEALRQRIDDDVPGVRAEAVRGIARHDESFDPVPFLDDPDMTVRRFAAEALVERCHPTACDHIVRMAFANDGADRLEAADLLRRCAPEAANTTLIERLATAQDGFTRRISIEVLARLNASRPQRADVGISNEYVD